MTNLLDLCEDSNLEGGGALDRPLLIVRLGGEPMGKGRPRSTIIYPKFGKPFVSVYTPPATRQYEADLRAAAIDAMAGRPIFEHALRVVVFAFFIIPPSYSNRHQVECIQDERRPASTPDCDNILKMLDAFNPVEHKSGLRVPVVWRDDALVVDARVVKIYAKKAPGLIVEVYRAPPPPEPWREDSAD